MTPHALQWEYFDKKMHPSRKIKTNKEKMKEYSGRRVKKNLYSLGV
jgi:hypothetical protein